ncbi:hypothetical protein NQ314_020152, partial [Rhamnusium bicolor]
MRSFQLQVLDGEVTIATFQKRLSLKKENLIRLGTELQQVRTDYLYLMHNMQVQLVLRRGLVETALTGELDDFKDAILFTKEMQQYLKSKASGRKGNTETFESEMELMAAAYENRIKDKKEKYMKIKKQIQSYKDHNDALDKAIKDINVDVCDLKLKKDDKLKVKENEVLGL